MEKDILDFLNKQIRAEHGASVTINSMWSDANVDSFGTTVVFLEMEEKYGIFDRDWFSTTNFATLTVRDVVEKVVNESTKL